jgi:hypothetical protein
MKHNMKDLESVGFRTIALAGDDAWPNVRDLLSTGRKSIVYLPTKNQFLANGCSRRYHDDLLRQIESEFPKRRVLSFVGSVAFQKREMDRFLGKGMTESRPPDLRGAKNDALWSQSAEIRVRKCGDYSHRAGFPLRTYASYSYTPMTIAVRKNALFQRPGRL